jgi:putative endonuclease
MCWLPRLLAGLPLRGTLGRRGERLAAKRLKAQGYRILGTNLRWPVGEIDVLAEAPDGRTIVVVEVKTGTGGSGELRPEVHVNAAKERKLAALASHAARRYGWSDRPIRFDVMGIDLPDRGEPTVRHHVGAFQSRF